MSALPLKVISARVGEEEAAREKLVMTARPMTAQLVAGACVGRLPGTEAGMTTSG